jgi:hypothetical protein
MAAPAARATAGIAEVSQGIPGRTFRIVVLIQQAKIKDQLMFELAGILSCQLESLKG